MVAMAEIVPSELYAQVGRLCAHFANLENAVAQAIWLELRLEHDLFGHPVTDRLQMRESFKLLISIHQRARNDKVVAHLKSIQTRLDDITERRNLVVHGTVEFHSTHIGDPGIRWVMRRGAFNRQPQEVTPAMLESLTKECKELTDDLRSIGRFN